MYIYTVPDAGRQMPDRHTKCGKRRGRCYQRWCGGKRRTLERIVHHRYWREHDELHIERACPGPCRSRSAPISHIGRVNAVSLETWELMSYVVTVIGLPLAIGVFLFEQRKERENE